MSKVIDMTGQRYGRLVVIERGENDKHGKAQWWCQCDCGSPKKLINGAALRRGLTISCGCNKLEKLNQYNQNHTIDETGNRYGKLVVISRNEDPSLQVDGRAMWNCQCDCGNKCVVSGRSLRVGHTASCGCGVRSLGELKIKGILENNNLNFCEQYKICINQNEYQTKQPHPYYFDFAIIENNQLKYLIEYDGEQHFLYKKNTDHWSNKEHYEKTKIRDMIKNQWCKENKIPLIRIPYTRLELLCIEDLLLETSNFIYNGGD